MVNNGAIVNSSGANTIYGAGNANFTFTNGGTITATGGTLTDRHQLQNDSVTNNFGGTDRGRRNGTTLSVGMGWTRSANNGTLEATGAGRRVYPRAPARRPGQTTPTLRSSRPAAGTVDMGVLHDGEPAGRPGGHDQRGRRNARDHGSPHQFVGLACRPERRHLHTRKRRLDRRGHRQWRARSPPATGASLNGVTMNGKLRGFERQSTFNTTRPDGLPGGDDRPLPTTSSGRGGNAFGLNDRLDGAWTGKMSIYVTGSGVNVVNDGTITNTNWRQYFLRRGQRRASSSPTTERSARPCGTLAFGQRSQRRLWTTMWAARLSPTAVSCR